MSASVVKLDDSNSRAIEAIVAAHERGQSTPLDDMLFAWWKRYRVFTIRRFNQFSRGGGDWASLAESTKRGRRQGKKKSKGGAKYSTLVDTGQLKAAIGSETTMLRRRVGAAVDFGFPATSRRDGKLTMGGLAAIHQFGTRTIPARPILVQPDALTTRQMGNDAKRMERSLKAVLKK